MGEWVLIFVQLSQSVPIVGPVAVGVQPIYFQTETACRAVAGEFNDGPEPSKDTPNNKRRSWAALCRATR